MTRFDALWLFVLLVLLSTRAAAAEGVTREIPPQGVIVVAGPDARVGAKALARTIYQRPLLRPAVDEATVRVLVSDAPAAIHPEQPNDPAQRENVELVQAAVSTSSFSVRQSVLHSLATKLNAELVLYVTRPAGEEGEGRFQARIMRTHEQRFMSLVLYASAASATESMQWLDAVVTLEGLVRRRSPAAGPPIAPIPHAPAPAPAPAPSAGGIDDEDGVNLLTSPWFWGGLGAVVVVGVTVLVLSQTTLNEPDTVVLEGRVGP